MRWPRSLSGCFAMPTTPSRSRAGRATCTCSRCTSSRCSTAIARTGISRRIQRRCRARGDRERRLRSPAPNGIFSCTSRSTIRISSREPADAQSPRDRFDRVDLTLERRGRIYRYLFLRLGRPGAHPGAEVGQGGRRHRARRDGTAHPGILAGDLARLSSGGAGALEPGGSPALARGAGRRGRASPGSRCRTRRTAAACSCRLPGSATCSRCSFVPARARPWSMPMA